MTDEQIDAIFEKYEWALDRGDEPRQIARSILAAAREEPQPAEPRGLGKFLRDEHDLEEYRPAAQAPREPQPVSPLLKFLRNAIIEVEEKNYDYVRLTVDEAVSIADALAQAPRTETQDDHPQAPQA